MRHRVMRRHINLSWSLTSMDVCPVYHGSLNNSYTTGYLSHDRLFKAADEMRLVLLDNIKWLFLADKCMWLLDYPIWIR